MLCMVVMWPISLNKCHMWKVGQNVVQMMLDSGSSVSLLQQNSVATMKDIQRLPRKPSMQLVTAAGSLLHVTDYVQAPVWIGGNKVMQQFLVVESLIAPVILGLDFMRKHKVTLDFSTKPVGVTF